MSKINRDGAEIDIGGVLRGYLTAALWTSQGTDAGCGIPETSGEFHGERDAKLNGGG